MPFVCLKGRVWTKLAEMENKLQKLQEELPKETELVNLLQGVTELDELRDLEDTTNRKAQLKHEEDILLQKVATSDEEKQG